MEAPLLDDYNSSEDLSQDTCQICSGQWINGENLNLSSCNHNFHYTCFPKENLFKKSKCPLCKTKFSKITFKTLNNFATYITAHMKGSFYDICQQHHVNNEIDGISILLGRYRKDWREHILKFKIIGTSHSCYILYSDWENPKIIDKSQVSKFPFAIRNFKCNVSLKINLNEKEISRLEVTPIVVKHMNMILIKIVLVNGIESTEMPGILDLKEIATQLPL